MKKGLLLLLVISTAILFVVSAFSALGQSNNFIIVNADDSNFLSFTASSELNNLVTNVTSRYVLLYANEVRFQDIVPIPTGLQTLLNQVGTRYVILYANENRWIGVDYPLELIDDNIPPQESAVSVVMGASDEVKINWVTNEYTTSVLNYGVESGVYTQSVSDNIYKKQHEIALGSLISGETYYFQILDTDRSGNTVQSGEHSFTKSAPVYLPMIIR